MPCKLHRWGIGNADVILILFLLFLDHQVFKGIHDGDLDEIIQRSLEV